MKTILSIISLTVILNSAFSQWTLVGPESFSISNCKSVRLSDAAGTLTVVTDPYDSLNSTNYAHPYQFNGTSWLTYQGLINHSAFSTNPLNPDIEMNSTNEFFILTFGGPNKSYLWQENGGSGGWDLVDSIEVNHTDLEPLNSGGDMMMAGYGGLFQYAYGTGAHASYNYPTLMSSASLVLDGSNDSYTFHASNANSFKVSKYDGAYSTMDSINHGQYLYGDVAISNGQPVYCNVDPNNNKILVSLFNGTDWDTTYLTSPNSYDPSKTRFNIECDADFIYLGVSSAEQVTVPSNQTTTTIEAFQIWPNLTSHVHLGEVVSFTFAGLGEPADFDLEHEGTDVYVAYVNEAPSEQSKVSVKHMDAQYVGVESQKELDFTIYPNPTNGEFNINTTAENYTVNVIDLSGKIILSAKGSSTKVIDLQDLNAGIYFVNIQVDGLQSKTSKLIVK